MATEGIGIVDSLRRQRRSGAATHFRHAQCCLAASLPWLTPLSAFAQERPYGGWGMHAMWGTGGVVMMIMMLVFWALIIAALVLGIRWLIHDGPGRGQTRTDRALEILRERFARGEIDREEFEAKKRDLT